MENSNEDINNSHNLSVTNDGYPAVAPYMNTSDAPDAPVTPSISAQTPPTITSSHSSYASQYNGHPSPYQNSPQYNGNTFVLPSSQTNHSGNFSFEIPGFKVSIFITPISYQTRPIINNLQQDYTY